MKNIYFKKLYIICLMVFLFPFFILAQTSNTNTLSISTTTSTIETGASASIKAQIPSGISPMPVKIFFTTTGGDLNPAWCQPVQENFAIYSCSVAFSSVVSGSYTITASATSGLTNYTAGPLKIGVTPRAQGSAPFLVGRIEDPTPPTISVGDSNVKLKITAGPLPISAGPVVRITAPAPQNINTTCTVNSTDGVCYPLITLPTGSSGAASFNYTVSYSTNNWPNHTGTVSGSTNVSVVNAVTGVNVCLPPNTLNSDGTCSCNPPNTKINNICTAPIDANKDSVYKFLEPIGTETTFDPGQPDALSKYLNMLIKIVIGLAAMLAMVMIVMGGIQYMTSELISSKEEAKKRITNAILGLLVALGSYVLLYTVNPDLLKVEPKLDATYVELDIEEDATPILDDSRTPLPPAGTAVRGCSGQIVNVPIPSQPGSVFKACSTISSRLSAMLVAANSAGIRLSGGGYRDPQTQINLRRQHCGTSQYDIYEKPSRLCNPQTARPGRSMHETGQAFDLKCNGTIINWDGNPKNARFGNHPQTRVCFNWLAANAGSFGLYNLPSENWHWSTTGR